ncbi:nuclear transport factor 2 [Tanacetum coccineum]
MQAIDAKIRSLNYGDFKFEIKSFDAQTSLNCGVILLVIGCMTGKDNIVRDFSQSFFLAPQEGGYFVLNDMFRYIDNVSDESLDLEKHPGGEALLIEATGNSIDIDIDIDIDNITKERYKYGNLFCRFGLGLF